MKYWPGTNIKKSTGNAFDVTRGPSIFSLDRNFTGYAEQQRKVAQKNLAQGKTPKSLPALAKARP